MSIYYNFFLNNEKKKKKKLSKGISNNFWEHLHRVASLKFW